MCHELCSPSCQPADVDRARCNPESARGQEAWAPGRRSTGTPPWGCGGACGGRRVRSRAKNADGASQPGARREYRGRHLQASTHHTISRANGRESRSTRRSLERGTLPLQQSHASQSGRCVFGCGVFGVFCCCFFFPPFFSFLFHVGLTQHNNGLRGDVQLVQLIEDPADLVVQPRHRRKVRVPGQPSDRVGERRGDVEGPHRPRRAVEERMGHPGHAGHVGRRELVRREHLT